MLGALLCHLGFHQIDQKTSEIEPLREFLGDSVSWLVGMQKRISPCARPDCGFKQKAYRIQTFGIGGMTGSWKKLSVYEEEIIDSLPTP